MFIEHLLCGEHCPWSWGYYVDEDIGCRVPGSSLEYKGTEIAVQGVVDTVPPFHHA